MKTRFSDYAESAARGLIVLALGLARSLIVLALALLFAKFLMVHLHGFLDHLAWVATR